MKEFLVKNKKILLCIFIILILIILGVSIFLVFNVIKQKDVISRLETDNYSLQYDNTWKIIKEEESEVDLIHKKSKSELNIKINELQDENQYMSIGEIFESLLFNIQNQNKDYKLIYKEQVKLTKQKIDGYTILFEADSGQASIYIYKQGNRLVIIQYEALNEYFDILLDNVSNIVYNFTLKEKQFDVKSSINLKTKDINYTEQPDVSSMLKNAKQETIASSNYLVEYTIPDNFKSTKYDTESGSYNFENMNSGTYLRLSTNILTRNLYEYLDKESTTNIYSNYNLNSYNRANEELNKYSDKPLTYIYKNNYLTNNKISENIEIVFELNQNHIFIVKISSNGVGIPKELVKMIKISNFKNIASNINIEKNNGFLIGRLKQYTNYEYNQTEEIILKLPESYQEIDNDTNLYEERNYVSDYYEEVKIPKYEVKYKIITFSVEDELDILNRSVNKNLGTYKEFAQIQDKTFNEKDFKIYERGYTRVSTESDSSGNQYKYYTNEKVLFYELQSGKYLVIIIDGNENNITDDLIAKLTNFDVNIK